MKLHTIIRFLLLLILIWFYPLVYYAQDESQWVSIANEFLKVSVDRSTGRYVVYDARNYHPPVTHLKKLVIPSQLFSSTAPVNSIDAELSPLLGKAPEVLNFTTFNIDKDIVIFGSSDGMRVGDPIVQNNNILYTWRIGNLDIIQKVAIVMNSETKNEDAVIITYEVKNNSTENSRNITTRIVLDPIVNHGKTPPFYLPDRKEVLTEYEASLGDMPEYWISADQNSKLSRLSVKGITRGYNVLTPRRIFLTTMEKVLLDPWNFKHSRKLQLQNQNTAVVLFYDKKQVFPQSTSTLASTIITIPSLIDKFGRNGLEVRTSAFINKNTTPLNIDLWVKNIGQDIFDSVEFTLEVPYSLEIFDYPVKKIASVRPLDTAQPVSWVVGVKEFNDQFYKASVLVKGYQNGVVVSNFDIPIDINLDSKYIQLNKQELDQVVKRGINNISQVPTKFTTLLDGDNYGSDLESLTELYQYLHSVNADDHKEVIKMIETEQQLIQEIQGTEKSIQKINEQYNILFQVYQRMFQNNLSTDGEVINIQEIAENINDLELKLKQQEVIFSELDQKFNTSLKFE